MKRRKGIIGARTFKTALAVLLCLIVDAFVLKSDKFYSSFAAVICMTPTTDESLSVGINRTVGTFMSGFFSAAVQIAYYLFPDYKQLVKFILVPFFIIVIIEFFVAIKRPQAISIASAVFLVISLGPEVSIENLADYIIVRIFETVVGIVIAVMVNIFILPYNKNWEEKDEEQQE